MKTIYLLQRLHSYGNPPTILRAYESKTDADDIVKLMERAGYDKFEVVELELETAQPHTPLPLQPRFVPTKIISGELDASA